MNGSVFRGVKVWLMALGVAALSACGSGGGGSDPLPPLPPVPAAPTITTQPAAVAVTAGQAASFSVVAAGTGLLYQWRRDGVNISGTAATAATYTLSNPALVDSGARFSVTVANLGGTVTSADAVLTVLEVPAIARGPDPASVVTGNTATFTVVASGSAPLNYQWRRAGVAIPGATLASYSFTPTLADNNTVFSVVVSNSAGTVTSDPATLSVFAVPQAITILSQPQDVTVRDTQRATFNVVLSGTGPFTVQWIRNGVDIPTARLDNVSSTQYVFSIVQALLANNDNGALYSLRITNAFGSVTTRQALLTVTP